MKKDMIKKRILNNPSTSNSEKIVKSLIKGTGYNFDALFPLFSEYSRDEEEHLRIFAAIGFGYLTQFDHCDFAAIFSSLEKMADDWSGKVIAYGLNKAMVIFFRNNPGYLLKKFESHDYVNANPPFFKAFLTAFAKFISKSGNKESLGKMMAAIDKNITSDHLLIQECLSTVINTLGLSFSKEITEKLKEWGASHNIFTHDIIRNALEKKLGKVLPMEVKEKLLAEMAENETQRILRISERLQTPGNIKIRYIERPAHTLLHRINVWFLPFNWGANPYRGCVHACEYCNARSSHEYLGNTKEEFERIIYIKVNAADALERDISNPRWKRQKNKLVNLGSVTDPYQMIDRKYQITRKVLEKFLAYQTPVTITTKSDLVVRDIDLLKRMGELVNVVFSIPTLDEKLISLIERGAPSIKRRLDAIEKLKRQGVVVGVLMVPILPYISDNKDNIRELCKVLHHYKVDYVLPDILNLRGDVKIRMEYFLKKHDPSLIKQYKELYKKGKNNEFADKKYVKDIFDFLMKDCLKKYNLNDYSKMIKGKWQ